jgi:NAD(P)-dependent dehydrogenase (short-subunit alcohol dehydrogenase family)
MASNCARYEGQVAAITGGAQGIGFGIAQRLGREGATVILLDMNGDALDSAREALEKESIKAATFQLNVTDAAQVTKVFEEIVAQHKQLDVLVQSAGVTGKTGIKTEEVDPKNFQFVFDVNVNGVFLCCQAALRHMTKRQYGRIINIGRQQELMRERSYFCFVLF